MKSPFSRDFYLNLLLGLSFILLLPIFEWPDALAHYSNLRSALSFLPEYSIHTNHNFSYFSDSTFYLYEGYQFVTFYKIIYFVPILYLSERLHFYCSGFPFPFNPVIVFSFISFPHEALAVFFLLASFWLVFYKRSLLFIFFAVFSVVLDRSFIPSILVLIYIFFNLHKNDVWLTLAIFFVALIHSFQDPLIEILFSMRDSFFGIGMDNVDELQSAGKRPVFALISSVTGLFGVLSIRPMPFLIYYPIVLVVVIIGVCARSELRLFLISLLPIFLVVSIFGPLSQARYYPIFSYLFWLYFTNGLRRLAVSDLIAKLCILGMILIALFFTRFSL